MMVLQVIWFVLIGVLLTGYALLDGFDLGVGFWHLRADKKERGMMIHAISPMWDGNQVWLLTGGGAIFAAFSGVYATVFSGFYLALILVLLGLILRAVSIVFRDMIQDDGWRTLWDIAFSVGSILPGLLFGVAVGNVIRGIPLDGSGNYTGNFFYLLNPYALLVGLTGLAMFAVHGALFIALKTSGELMDKARRWAAGAWWVYAVGYAASALLGIALYKRAMGPYVPGALAVIGLVALFELRRHTLKARDLDAFLMSCLSIVTACVGSATLLFPCLVPASNDGNLNLTIYNASSSFQTLWVMFIMALLGMPVVIGYTIYIYRVFAGRLSVVQITEPKPAKHGEIIA